MPSATAEASAPSAGPLTPRLFEVVGRKVETTDVVTVALAPRHGAVPLSDHGQFNMLTAFGVGEAAISVSALSASDGPVEHTVRDVGPVTHALCATPVGGTVGVRGPFGTGWAAGPDLLPLERTP